MYHVGLRTKHIVNINIHNYAEDIRINTSTPPMHQCRQAYIAETSTDHTNLYTAEMRMLSWA